MRLISAMTGNPPLVCMPNQHRLGGKNKTKQIKYEFSKLTDSENSIEICPLIFNDYDCDGVLFQITTRD